MQTIKEEKESHKRLESHCCTETTVEGRKGGGDGAGQLTIRKLVIWCNQKGITAENGTQVVHL